MTTGMTILTEIERLAREHDDDPAQLECVWLDKTWGEWDGPYLKSRTTRHTGPLSSMPDLPWDMCAFSPQFVYFLQEGVGVACAPRNPDSALVGKDRADF